MRLGVDLRLVDEDDDLDLRLPFVSGVEDDDREPARQPPVFARLVQAPPGLPWEQSKAALLEARHSAPLPIAEMLVRLKRLTPWRSGEPGKFAAGYVRAAEVSDRITCAVDVDGQTLQLTFEPADALARRARRSLFVAAASAGVVTTLFVAVTAALLARSQAEDRLAFLENQATSKLRRAEAAQAAWRQSSALLAARPGYRVETVTADLAWAMSARDPDARIEAWRWDRGLSAVEARTDTSPFKSTDRSVRRVDRPLRRGVWLWGVEPPPGRDEP